MPARFDAQEAVELVGFLRGERPLLCLCGQSLIAGVIFGAEVERADVAREVGGQRADVGRDHAAEERGAFGGDSHQLIIAFGGGGRMVGWRRRRRPRRSCRCRSRRWRGGGGLLAVCWWRESGWGRVFAC